MPALHVCVDDGRTVASRIVPVSPMNQREDRGIELETLFRQSILIPRWCILVGNANEDVLGNKLRQPLAQDLACDLETAFEVLETPHAEKAVAQHH